MNRKGFSTTTLYEDMLSSQWYYQLPLYPPFTGMDEFTPQTPPPRACFKPGKYLVSHGSVFRFHFPFLLWELGLAFP